MQKDARGKMGLVANISLLLILYTVMVVLHETGHVLMLKYFGVKKIKYDMLKNKDLFCITYPGNLSKKKKRAVLLVGIVLGACPLFLFPRLDIFFIACLGTLYVLMCKHDIKRYQELS